MLDHGVDGMDQKQESLWCWMKYVRCARNKTEQNAIVFQFGADIYFQTYKAIKPGEEILVWYADYYEQYRGIPVGVRKVTKTKESSHTGKRANSLFSETIRLPDFMKIYHKIRGVKQ